MQRAFAEALNDGDIQLKISQGTRPELRKVPEKINGIPVKEVIESCWQHGM
jgi:hypothetical protein